VNSSFSTAEIQVARLTTFPCIAFYPVMFGFVEDFVVKALGKHFRFCPRSRPGQITPGLPKSTSLSARAPASISGGRLIFCASAKTRPWLKQFGSQPGRDLSGEYQGITAVGPDHGRIPAHPFRSAGPAPGLRGQSALPAKRVNVETDRAS
jgi:hypothetical protein